MITPPQLNAKYLQTTADRALRYFRSTEHNLDSAAAVYAIFRGPESEQALKTPEFCENGGLCGALHAAAVLRPDLEDVILQQFQDTAGGCLCDEIRAAAKLPCHRCVQLACQLLQDYGTEYLQSGE